MLAIFLLLRLLLCQLQLHYQNFPLALTAFSHLVASARPARLPHLPRLPRLPRPAPPVPPAPPCPAPPACLRLAAQRAPLLLWGTVLLCLSAALLHPPCAYGDSSRSDLESLLSLFLLRQAHPLAEEISCELDTRPLECSSRRLHLSVPWALPFTK